MTRVLIRLMPILLGLFVFIGCGDRQAADPPRTPAVTPATVHDSADKEDQVNDAEVPNTNVDEFFNE